MFQGPPCVFQGPHSNVPLRTSDIPQDPMTWHHRNDGQTVGGAPPPPRPPALGNSYFQLLDRSGRLGLFACKVPGELPAPLPQKRLPAGPRGGVPEQLCSWAPLGVRDSYPSSSREHPVAIGWSELRGCPVNLSERRPGSSPRPVPWESQRRGDRPSQFPVAGSPAPHSEPVEGPAMPSTRPPPGSSSSPPTHPRTRCSWAGPPDTKRVH